jgi:hypothetical protein
MSQGSAFTAFVELRWYGRYRSIKNVYRPPARLHEIRRTATKIKLVREQEIPPPYNLLIA